MNLKRRKRISLRDFVPLSMHRMKLRRVGMYECATQCRDFPQLRISSVAINRCGKRAARWTQRITKAQIGLTTRDSNDPAWVAECLEVSR